MTPRPNRGRKYPYSSSRLAYDAGSHMMRSTIVFCAETGPLLMETCRFPGSGLASQHKGLLLGVFSQTPHPPPSPLPSPKGRGEHSVKRWRVSCAASLIPSSDPLSYSEPRASRSTFSFTSRVMSVTLSSSAGVRSGSIRSTCIAVV